MVFHFNIQVVMFVYELYGQYICNMKKLDNNKQLIKDIEILLTSVFHIYPALLYPIKGGWSALAYFVENRSGEKFLLKIYDKARSSTAKLTADIECYMPIVDWLYSNTQLHNRIVNPVRTENGKYKYENSNYAFLLFRYIDGRTITEGDFSDEQVIQLANILAELHSYGANIPLDTQSVMETYDIGFCSSLEKIMQQANSLKKELSNLLSKYSDKLENAINELELLAIEVKEFHPQYLLCHTDIHEGNILQTEDGIVLIDWENLKLAPADADFFH